MAEPLDYETPTPRRKYDWPARHGIVVAAVILFVIFMLVIGIG